LTTEAGLKPSWRPAAKVAITVRRLLTIPWLFYPVAVIVAALLIAGGLRPEWPAPHYPTIAASRLGPTFVLHAEALANVQAGNEHYTYVDTDQQGVPIGVRIARRSDKLTQATQGALLAFAPSDIAALTGKPCTLEIFYRPLQITTAASILVKWDGSPNFVLVPIEPREGVVRLQLPAGDIGVGLRITPENDLADYHYGVELVEVRITPGVTASNGTQ
jgi:hypothetical protein